MPVPGSWYLLPEGIMGFPTSRLAAFRVNCMTFYSQNNTIVVEVNSARVFEFELSEHKAWNGDAPPGLGSRVRGT